MLTVEILNGFKIPLCIIGNLAYTKTANVIPTSRLKLRVRGFQCRELSLAIKLTPAVLNMFNEVNTIKFERFSDLVKYFIGLVPNINNKPFHVYLANECIIPELLFSVTSATQTFQSDLNGNIQACDINLVLSGVKCSKESFVNPTASSDDNATIPTVIIHNSGRECKCEDNISISNFILTPTTLELDLILSDSFKHKNDKAWLNDLTASDNSFITVEGYGSFYIENASLVDSILKLECSVFSREQKKVITNTIFTSTLPRVTSELKGSIRYTAKDTLKQTNVEYYYINANTPDTLKELQDNLGFLCCFRDNEIILYEVPENLYNSNALPFPITDDISSAKTCKIVYRDSVHSFEAGAPEGNTVLINSPVCTNDDRSAQLLRYYNFMENQIAVVVPYDNRIKHHSTVALVKDDQYIYCLVTNYSIDILSNTMTLNLNYITRG